MLSSRTATALVGLLVSLADRSRVVSLPARRSEALRRSRLALSAALWYYVDSLLFVPFVPFLFRGRGGEDQRRPEVAECPACGYRTPDAEYDYCPRDGTRLERVRSDEGR